MYNKKLVFGLVALLAVMGTTLPGQAADKKAATETKTNAPIVIEGDQLAFSDLTGEVFAQGNVKVTQDQATVLADNIRGNTKQSEVWVDGKATFLQLGVNLVGLDTHYNYKEKTGTMLKASGMVDKERVTGQNMEFFPEKLVIHDGTMTKCPAKVPDYHVSASKIEIWPGDKMIAYNVKFWIKDKVIYSMPKYKKDLTEDSNSSFPKIGYNSDDGVYIRQHLEYPVTDNIGAFTDLAYYSKSGFKPAYGLIDREKNYSLTLAQGDFQDDDDNWIKKEPELKLNYHSRRLGNLPVSYTFSAVYGKWTDDYKTSWHQDYNLYFSHDPIKLNSTTTLYLGTGYEVVSESYNSSTTNSYKFDVTATKAFSPKLDTWVGYSYRQNKNNVFEYNSVDLSKELKLGLNYRIDNMNAITYSQSYDLENHRIHDEDYIWHRNLHCWQLDITYRAKRDQIKFNLNTTHW